MTNRCPTLAVGWSPGAVENLGECFEKRKWKETKEMRVIPDFNYHYCRRRLYIYIRRFADLNLSAFSGVTPKI